MVIVELTHDESLSAIAHFYKQSSGRFESDVFAAVWLPSSVIYDT